MANDINSFDDNSVGKIALTVRRLIAQYHNAMRHRTRSNSRGDLGYTIRTGVTTVNSQFPVYPASGCKFVVRFDDWAFEESVGGCDLDTRPWPSKYVVARTYGERYLEEGTPVVLVKIPGKKGRRWYILPGELCCGCEIFTDNFDRPNDTDIGSGWVEVSGDWEIDTNRLAANDLGLVYTTKRHTDVQRNAGFTCKDVQPLKIYRLCFVSDEGTVRGCVLLDCGTAFDNVGTVSLEIGGSTVDSFEFVYDPGEDLNLFTCVNESGTYGGLAEISIPVWDCSVPEDAPRMGIQNGGIEAEYDNFYWFEHSTDVDNPELNCRPCSCECDGECVPRALTGTLESSCAHRDGLTVNLALNDAFYPAFVWEGTASWPQPLPPFTPTTYHFRLFCSRSTGGICGNTQFALCAPEFMGGCSSDTWDQDLHGLCTELGTTGRCSDSESCDPIEIRFGPGTCAGSGDPEPEACTETIVVTA